MTSIDPVVIITGLKEEIADLSAIIKNALVLLQQFGARIAADKAVKAADDARIALLEAQIAAVPDLTATVQTDTKSLSDAIAQFSASGQLNV